jgi:TP901-1 family phage major tail protein
MGDKHAGKDLIVCVNTGTYAAPVWTSIGGQRTLSLGRTADEIETSDKTSAGWKSFLAGLKEWTLEVEVVIEESDNGRQTLEDAYENDTRLDIAVQLDASTIYRGYANITDFSLEAPYDDAWTGSLTLKGDGALTPTSY